MFKFAFRCDESVNIFCDCFHHNLVSLYLILQTSVVNPVTMRKSLVGILWVAKTQFVTILFR